MNVKRLLTQILKRRSVLLFILIFLSGHLIFAQESFKLSGRILDADGSGIPGVNIVEKGTSNASITDLDGKFVITLSNQNAVIVVTSFGYETQEISVAGQASIDVNLSPSAEAIDEVVIVGYGQMKKTDVTGSVSSMSDKVLTERSVNNPMEAIQGNVAGVQIKSSSGRLGDEFDISIRGKNSLSTGAKPLYIVDGVASDGIDYLNPEDIARIDILKDASSTAIYGSRGSNGVIIVTTKSGATAKSGISVSFDSYYGIKKVARFPDLMDGPTWWNFHRAAYLSATPMSMRSGQLDTAIYSISASYPGPYGQNRYLYEAVQNGSTYDWDDAILSDGVMTNNYLSISGQGEKISYNLGVGIQNETGLIDKESIDKYSIKAGFDQRINKMFAFGTNLTVAKTKQEQGNNTAMQDAFRYCPLMTPYAEDGVTLFIQPGKLTDASGRYLVNKTSTWNPILDIQNASDLTNRLNLVSSTYLEFKPIEWLTLKSTLSAGYDNKKRGQSWGALTEVGHSKNDKSVGQITMTNTMNYTWDNQLNFDYSLKENHHFNLLALQSIYSTVTERSFDYANNMPFDGSFYNLEFGDQTSYVLSSSDVKTGYFKQSLASFALRLNYNFKGKYLVTLSNRWDGSSLLSEGNKWAAFPSGALAWRISEESFLKNQDILSNLKLRVSLGYTGNNVIQPYSTVQYINKKTYYSFGSTTAVGCLPSSVANPELTWEKTREFNAGFDFGFLKNKIIGTVDLYDRLSDEILMDEKLPLEAGWDQYSANVGSVSNKGVEVSLTTVNIDNKLITWETSFIFSKNINEIVSIHGQKEDDDIGNNWFIGRSIDSYYNYKYDGVVQASEAGLFGLSEGMAKVVDVNQDGVISADADRVILGHSNPEWTGSFNTRLRVANFDLSASVITNQGVFVKSPFHADFLDLSQRGRQKLNVSYYVPENTAGVQANFTNEYPRPGPTATGAGTYWITSGVGYYRDASFVKVKNICLGYNFPSELLSKIKIKSLRLYFNVIDPFVFTDYDGYDPEWAAASLDVGRVASVTYQLGLNLKF